MSKKHLTVALAAAVLAGATLLAGCGSSNGDAPSSIAPAAVKTPETPSDIELGAGVAGPVRIGMTKAEVVGTGVFDADVSSGVDGCPVHPLAWTKNFDGILDVQALADGSVASIGVRKPGPRTASGLQVGSTYADVIAANPGAEAVEAGYGQAGVLVHDEATDGWIGYLFNATVKKVKSADKVTFIEITAGRAPGLMRDGC